LDTNNPTATTESELDDFDALMLRLESTIFRLKLVAESFGDLGIQGVASTEEHGPAAYVVTEAAGDLVRVYQGLITLHKHTPKEVQS
jgi:hypothetical protein